MKSIEQTPRVRDLLAKHLGGEAPLAEDIVVFEATVVSTAPLNKPGSIWHKAIINRSTLVAMAETLNAGTQVPLQSMHVTSDLPVGRLFYGQVFDDQEKSSLNAYFYLNKSEAKLIGDIETAVIQAVSVGIQSQNMRCSECGFDYLGPDADIMNFWGQQCDEGHVIGVDGVHILSSGLENWFETSLVARGASKDAAIINRTRARLTSDEVQKLAASGKPFEAIILVATQNQGNPTVELKELIERLEAQAAEIANLNATVADLTAAAEAASEEDGMIKASLDEANAKIAALEVDLTASQALVEANGDVEAIRNDGKIALEFAQDQARKALIASGTSNPVAPETIAECLEVIEKSGKTLAQLAAGWNQSVQADAITSKPLGSSNAFKSARQ